MASRCSVSLLGGFRVEIDGALTPKDAWRHRRAADLVKLLSLAPGHRLNREQAIDALWPHLGPEAGASNLRKAVHYARRALGSDRSVAMEGGIVVLWPEGQLSIDVDGFETLARRALDIDDGALAERAASGYAGELLPEDRFAEWTQGPRERLRRRHLQVLRLAGRWERLVELDPSDEEAHRELMRGHLQAGNRQAAMRQFERLRRTLHEEVGVGPDPLTVALYEQVLALEGTEPATPGERARAHLAAGLVALNRQDLVHAEREARLARAIAVQEGMGRELGEASGLLGMVAHSRGDWRKLFTEEFIAAIQGSPQLAENVFEAHLCLAEFSLYGREGPDAVAGLAAGLLESAERSRSLHGEAVATLMLGESLLLSGQLDRAEQNLSLAAELHGKAGAGSGRALSLQRLAEAALARRRRVRAKRLLRDAYALALGSSLEPHLLVRIHGTRVLAASNGEGSAKAVRDAEHDLAGRDVCEPCSMAFLVAAATSCAQAGHLEEARRFLDHAERVAAMWPGGPWLASVWEARAEMRLAEGDLRQAAALFREAADVFSGVGFSLAASRCRAAADTSEAAPPGGSGTGR
jgi:DNA-binding SARP family transcriptional activator/tetratricopeptide (TPR) repeat protein